MDFSTFKQLPRQAIPDSQKTEQWGKDCVDACEGLVLLFNDKIRESRTNKQNNYNLYTGIINPKELEKITNPYNLQGQTFPAFPRNIPITEPYFKKLLGEEYNRRFDWHLAVINEDAISSKLEQQKEMINQTVVELLQQNQNLTPEQLQDPEVAKQMEQQIQEKLDDVMSWREERELAGTRILEYYTRKLDLKTLFNNGFEDALICGEEIYCIDEVNKEPKIRRCNPLMTYFLTNPHSHKIEDSNIIVEEQYLPLGELLDRYHKYLTKDEIKELEDNNFNGGTQMSSKNNIINYGQAISWKDPDVGLFVGPNVNNLSNDFNNYRVLRCVWRSIRLIKILHYLDENNDEQTTEVPSSYKPDKSLGQWTEDMSIGEFWEGTKIANKYYVKVQPRSIQFRTLNNISSCQSGYVGSVYNTNGQKVYSFMDKVKPDHLMYITMAYRTEMAFMKAKGKIGLIDKALIPDGMNMDMWMYYAEIMGWGVIDSFKEGKKGAAMGKLAGNNTNRSDSINLELGNYIQQHIAAMQQIEARLEKITGINDARRGNNPASAGLGTTQIAQQASYETTEPYFRVHDNIKLRVIAALLETAKYCLKNGNKTFQYILSDLNTEIFTIDGEQFNEAEFGIIASDAFDDRENLEALKRATEMSIQSGTIDGEELLTVFSNNSFSSKKHKLEKISRDKKKQQQANIEAEQKGKQADIQARVEHEKALLQLEYDKLDREDLNNQLDREQEIYLEQMRSLGMDEGSNIVDIEGAAANALKQQEINLKHLSEQSKLSIADRQRDQDKMIKEKELELKKQELQSKENIEKSKLKQVEVQNKNQIELANKKAALDKQMMDKKIQLETMKAKAAIQKAKQKPKAK